MAACALVLLLAGRRTDSQCLLEAGINPLKHLDAVISAQCWHGLGAERTAVQNSTRDGVLPIFSDFSQENEDREGIVQALLALSLRSELPKQVPDSPPPVHELCIVITGDQWVAKCELGRLWYDANNLADKDVAPFAMLDTLTRVLPHWRGGIVQILTSDVQLLWGVCGGPLVRGRSWGEPARATTSSCALSGQR
ncbi:hypothetical protein BC826DRAFT_646485 [Russula brevipes]|nr:hypothetical protein BC826DRAFT_646485 [Russula brevipes]